MKTLIVSLALCLINTFAVAQPGIDVPNFADPAVKTFYETYSAHLLKCVKAIREKKESEAVALFKDPGEQLVAKEKVIAKSLVKNPVEKQKYIQYARQAYPYLKEVEGSVYYQKIYGH